jgi:hypothetical protein
VRRFPRLAHISFAGDPQYLPFVNHLCRLDPLDHRPRRRLDLDIGRLQIAMNDSLLVRGFERIAYLTSLRQNLV